jgi:glutathione peroxidase
MGLGTAYTGIVNQNAKGMTTRQKLLKAAYPVLMWFGRFSGGEPAANVQSKAPVSFYTLPATLIDGTPIDLSSLKGKKLLLVNTASDCGYTAQLSELEELHQRYKGKVVVIGFPSNDFKQQEMGTDDEIAAFCRQNFGVSFLLMKKGSVAVKGNRQEIYRWLTDKNLNGWNAKAPSWNFCKYIIDEAGNLTHYFGSTVNPAGSKILLALQLEK